MPTKPTAADRVSAFLVLQTAFFAISPSLGCRRPPTRRGLRFTACLSRRRGARKARPGSLLAPPGASRRYHGGLVAIRRPRARRGDLGVGPRAPSCWLTLNSSVDMPRETAGAPQLAQVRASGTHDERAQGTPRVSSPCQAAFDAPSFSATIRSYPTLQPFVAVRRTLAGRVNASVA